MKKLILLIIICPLIQLAQQEVITNPWVKFSKDSIINSNLQNSITNFLSNANNRNFNTKYLDHKHYKKYEYFFNNFEEYSKSTFYKDSLFYKPYLLESYSFNKKDYYITLQFSGINTKNEVILNKILQFKAISKNNYYQFFCLFQENTKNWKHKKQKNITFHYSKTYNKKKARNFVNFNRELEDLTKKNSPILNYYKCTDSHEATAIFGILYSTRYANAGYGFGMSDDYGNFITGIDSEDYLHDHVHSFFGKIYDEKKTWREFEEGIAIYYGGNWGVPLSDLKTVLKNDTNLNFLAELKKGKKSKRYDHKHLYDRIICAIIAKEIIEKKGFDEAIDLLHSGNNGETFLTKLNKKLGINETNFNEKLNKIIN